MGRKTPHDALVSDTFGQPEQARSLLGGLLPDDVLDHLDLQSLQTTSEHFVDEKLQESETDLLFRLRTRAGSPVLVYVLLEHQSTAHPAMPLRLLRYMLRIWDKHQRESGEPTLPPILPLVLCNAPGGWTTARRLVELVEAPEGLLRALRPMLPDFEPLILDLEQVTEAELQALRAHPLTRLVLLLLKSIRLPDLFGIVFRWKPEWQGVYRLVGWKALVRSMVYIIECRKDATEEHLAEIERLAEAPEGEVLMNLAEKWRQEGLEKGMTLAEKCRQEGRQEGRTSVLARQLTLRFGPLPAGVEERLAAASEADLEAVAEALLAAPSLDDALAPLR